jgi:Arc/MetJ family transcription regulator
LLRLAKDFFKKVEFTTRWVQNGLMKTSVDLDDELAAEVRNAVSLTREKPATVLRMALRAGLPLVASRFQAPRPEGYFADAYRNYPKQRLEFEAAMAKGTAQKPER